MEKTFERYYGEHDKMAFFYIDLCRCGSLAWGASGLGHRPGLYLPTREFAPKAEVSTTLRYSQR